MHPSRQVRFALAFAAFAFAGCPSRQPSTDAGTDAADAMPDALPPICHAGTRWSPGQQVFREATTDWGLDALHAEGIRLFSVDFDSDGWADLVVLRGNPDPPDDFSATGTRQTWLLRNDQHGHFVDVTVASHFRANRTVTVADRGRPGDILAWADVDNDGDLDAFTGVQNHSSVSPEETSELMLNQGDGTFVLGPAENEFRIQTPDNHPVAGASFVDYDRDGFVDLWVVTNAIDHVPQQDHLYRGDGTGLFTEMTYFVGLETEPWFSPTGSVNVYVLNQGRGHSWGWAAAACDLNGDGNPELLAPAYGRSPNHLWQATRTADGVQYVNRTVASGYGFDENMDWTGDESARCWCMLHPTQTNCAGVPPPQYIQCTQPSDAFRWDDRYGREPFQLGGNSGTSQCVDIDNDGDLDVLTGEIAHWDVGPASDKSELLINTGDADVRFQRPGNDRTGLARHHPPADWNEGIITSAVFDFDNDGWLDIYLGDAEYPGTIGLLFHQDATGHFEPVPIADGIDQHRSFGSAVADFDHDGDLDIVVGHSLNRCTPGTECYPTQQVRFFENVLGPQGNFVQLHLTGSGHSNRSAIGARVTVTAGGVTQTQEVRGGYGHHGTEDDLTLHFGLGTACEATVTVRWPDAALTTQTLRVGAGHRYEIRQ